MKIKNVKKYLATTLASVILLSGTMGITTVQAEETDSQYYTAGTVIDSDGFYEICVGDDLDIRAGVFYKSDDSALDPDYWDFYSDSELRDILGDDGIYTVYAPDKDNFENAIIFDGPVPETAFGQYVSKFYAVSVKKQEALANWACSEGTVHSFGGTENITFSDNGDGKTVSVYSIYKNKTNTAKIPAKIVVANNTYKVTTIGQYALENKDIKSVTIPSSVTTIEKEAFYKAGKLKSITIQGKLSSVGDKAFSGINKKAVIKIKASASDYKKTVKLIKKAGVPNTVTFKRIK